MSYIDDCLLIADTIQDCRQNVADTIAMSNAAGFVVHPVKSVLNPTNCIAYLCFWLNSEYMTVKLTDKKAKKIKENCKNLLKQGEVKIHELAQAIGLMVASFQGVQYGKLFYRKFDNHKSKALKLAKGNYWTKTKLTTDCISDIDWWILNIAKSQKHMNLSEPSIALESDASKKEWGGCLVTEKGRIPTGGNWSAEEGKLHINQFELMDALFTIKCFGMQTKNSHIMLYTDNTTTMTYINNLGGTKTECNELAREISLDGATTMATG